MKIRRGRKNNTGITIVLCVFICIAIILTISGFISQLNAVIYANTLNNIEEIAVHDIKNLDAILDTTWESLDYVGRKIQKKEFQDLSALQIYLREECEISRFNLLGVIDSSGRIYDNLGTMEQLEDESEERQFLEGKIERFAERYNTYSGVLGNESGSLIYAVRIAPIQIGDISIVGVMAGNPFSEIEKNIKIESFEGKLYSIVFNTNGDMVANIMRNGNRSMRENFYKQMEAADLGEGYSVEKLREYNASRRSYMMRYTDSNGVEKILYAAPVENTTWTFAIIVPYNVFTEQNTKLAELVVRMLVILGIAILVLVVGIYFLLKASIRLRLEAQSKADFLSNMSHEIRTPLNGIIGLNHLMNLYLGNTEKVQEYLRKSNDTAEYLLCLVNDILDMSKLQAGSMEVVKEPFLLERLTDSLWSMQKDNFYKRGIRFEMDNEIVYPCLSGDELKLKQVLMNVLSNAAKFTPREGRVLFTLRQSADDKGLVDTVIRISDTGCGMSKEFQEKIFDVFTQERSKNSESIKGTGLEMSISYLIMQKMGGSISVESQIGKGSTFTVRFFAEPAKEEPADCEIRHKLTRADHRPVNILLAEDNELNAEILTEILRNEGFEVAHAGDGQKAVEMFAASAVHEFNVILMDVQMPVMNGYEACRMIRGMDREDAESVLIFACTANAFSEDKIRAMESGMNDFFVKPVDVNLLLQKLGMTEEKEA